MQANSISPKVGGWKPPLQGQALNFQGKVVPGGGVVFPLQAP